MSETIELAIISAGLASLVSGVFQLIFKIYEHSKEKKDRIENKRLSYEEKKEQVYIAAISRLLQIRKGFYYTYEMVMKDIKLKELISKDNFEFDEKAAQLRLYANDKIFNQYYELASFSRFAYAREQELRLPENARNVYDIQITLLARLMQEDLGYRKYNVVYDMIICPECGVKHDAISKCPNCGMDYDELQKKIAEIMKQAMEIEKIF